MYARHRFDISRGMLAFAARSCLRSPDGPRAALSFGPGWERENALACLSVRSGFDLLLGCLGWAAGSEILMSAVTIADIPRIASAHRLVPVPVDLDPVSLAPRLDLLERAVTARTRALVVAHLFGGRIDLAPLVAFARRHSIALIEDCAQSWEGPDDTGHPAADVSMFSFGPIKTATALGGALLRVSEPSLRARMADVQATWPVQSRRAYAARVAKYAALHTIGRPRPYRALARGAALAGRSLDDLVSQAARSFGSVDTAALLRALRQQPSAPLLDVLAHQIARFDRARLARRAEVGERTVRALGPRIVVVGATQPRHTHWVFPMLAPDPRALVGALHAAGFDGSQASSMIAVAAPADRGELDPADARRWLDKLVYLPPYPEMPDDDRARMIAVVRSVADPGEPSPC